MSLHSHRDVENAGDQFTISSHNAKVAPADDASIVDVNGNFTLTAWPSTTLPKFGPPTNTETTSIASTRLVDEESRFGFLIQCFFPFLLAGFGMVAAGVLLERASSWYFLSTIPETLVMIPALLGLKGNLEMTLASRLSTLANLNQLSTRSQQCAALLSNLALVQAQAIVVSFAAAALTVATSLIEGKAFVWAHAVSLTLIGVLTASMASFVLSTMMVGLAIVCKKCGANPDNICTPIAAMLGDVTTLSLLILFGTWLTRVRDDSALLQSFALGAFLASTALWLAIAMRNTTTRAVAKHGWFVIIVAMLISSAGGYVLKYAIARFHALAVFQPAINGTAGNLCAINASRISTFLHRYSKPGVLIGDVNDERMTVYTYANPLRTFRLRGEGLNTLLLLVMSIPGHTIFLALAFLIQFTLMFDWIFYLTYIFIGIVQLAILLYAAQFLCRVMWRVRLNPDDNAIPLLTSIGDLLGTSLLTLSFVFLSAVAPHSLDRLHPIHAEAIAI